MVDPVRRFLHVGCGPASMAHTPFARYANEWREVRMDVDSQARPDILGSMTDLHTMSLDGFDAVYSSHSIEHVFAHEIPIALTGFLKVLKPEGFALITCPDLQSVCEAVAQGNLKGVLYQSPAGPISAIDILYGHRPDLAAGHTFMAHKYGFTQSTMAQELKDVGFVSVAVGRRAAFFDLWAIAFKTRVERPTMDAAIKQYLPQI